MTVQIASNLQLDFGLSKHFLFEEADFFFAIDSMYGDQAQADGDIAKKAEKTEGFGAMPGSPPFLTSSSSSAVYDADIDPTALGIFWAGDGLDKPPVLPPTTLQYQQEPESKLVSLSP